MILLWFTLFLAQHTLCPFLHTTAFRSMNQLNGPLHLACNAFIAVFVIVVRLFQMNELDFTLFSWTAIIGNMHRSVVDKHGRIHRLSATLSQPSRVTMKFHRFHINKKHYSNSSVTKTVVNDKSNGFSPSGKAICEIENDCCNH